MNSETTRARLAETFIAADHPSGILARAAVVLAEQFDASVAICDANDLTVLACAGPAPDLGPVSLADHPTGGPPSVAVNAGTLTFVVTPALSDDGSLHEVVSFVARSYERMRDLARLVASESRLRMAQELAHLGSYDWEIQRDVNTWSDELYRIYGTEPQSFNASYERFLAFIHPDDRERVMAIHQHAYETGEPFRMEERIIRPDGTERTLSSNGVVIRDEHGTPVRMTGICWDITEIKAAESTRTRLLEAERARQQSLEINDTIVQTLALAAHSLDAGHFAEAAQLVGHTLWQARRMAGELLEQASDRGRDMDVLTRSEPLPGGVTPPRFELTAEETGMVRVLVADDTAGMRALIREFLNAANGFVVVGEASTGREAIMLAQSLHPDLVVLDLSMPEMDGMRAIPELRSRVPEAGILVLSGYGGAMVQRALDAGAHAYIEKGIGFDDLVPRARAVVASLAL